MNNFNDSTQFAVPSFVKHFILCKDLLNFQYDPEPKYIFIMIKFFSGLG